MQPVTTGSNKLIWLKALLCMAYGGVNIFSLNYILLGFLLQFNKITVIEILFI
jgi:hypothetical protein